MPLHLIKLCVGAESMDDLARWVEIRMKRDGEQAHTTRQMPKRADELLDGGSMYWVIKGQITCRQKLLELRGFTDVDGISRCDILLEPVLVPVAPRPRGPFQGWRYLQPKEAPPDLSSFDGGDLPPEFAQELARLGLM